MLPLFKPNKSGTGNLIDFNFISSRKEKNKAGLYLKIVKQSGPLSSPFAGSKQFCVIKFNEGEIAALLNSIERRTKWSTVHKGDEGPGRSITFNIAYRKDDEGNATKEVLGFNFNTSVGETKFGFSLNLNESVLIREFLRYTLHHLFDGLYSAEKGRMKDFKKNQEEVENLPVEDDL